MSNINIIKVKCNQCNKEYEIYLKPSARKQNSYYCCRECYELSKRKYINVKCKQCEIEFEVRCLEKPFKYFCSNECEENYKINNKFTVKNCDQCNKEITVFKAGMKNKKYCSLECKQLYIKNKRIITKICEYCNNDFQTHNNSKFCSISCGSKFNSKKQGLGINVRPGEIWNKGLDISDERIKKSVEKQKKTFAQNMKDGKIIMYFTGKKLTLEHRNKVSLGNAKAIIEGRKPHLPKFKGGVREDLGHYVRSSWEANFARVLKYLGRDYEHEGKFFELSNGTRYIPDFYDIKNNKYYEIKGFWIRDSKDKYELFKQEYPYIKVILIESKKYFRIMKWFKEKIYLE